MAAALVPHALCKSCSTVIVLLLPEHTSGIRGVKLGEIAVRSGRADTETWALVPRSQMSARSRRHPPGVVEIPATSHADEGAHLMDVTSGWDVSDMSPWSQHLVISGWQLSEPVTCQR